jgi:hypothetical protein
MPHVKHNFSRTPCKFNDKSPFLQPPERVRDEFVVNYYRLKDYSLVAVVVNSFGDGHDLLSCSDNAVASQISLREYLTGFAR